MISSFLVKAAGCCTSTLQESLRLAACLPVARRHDDVPKSLTVWCLATEPLSKDAGLAPPAVFSNRAMPGQAQCEAKSLFSGSSPTVLDIRTDCGGCIRSVDGGCRSCFGWGSWTASMVVWDRVEENWETSRRRENGERVGGGRRCGLPFVRRGM